MTLPVESFASYLSVPGKEHRRHEDYSANQFVHAIKAQPFKGYTDISCGQETARIDGDYQPATNQRRAAGLFASWARTRLRRLGLLKRCCLLAVPCSSSCQSRRLVGPPDVMVRAVVRLCGGGVTRNDCLEWKRAYPSSSRSGKRRSLPQLYDNLVLVDIVPPDLPLVLVDDVCTQGFHLKACEARVREAGGSVVLALCAGRTHNQLPALDDPFHVPPERLALYRP